MAHIPQFGNLIFGVNYVLRPGGYAIIRGDAPDKIAIVSMPTGNYLPGGGQDMNESPEDAAIREAYEECGMRIRIDRCVGVADQLTWANDEATHFRKRCTFFTAELLRRDPVGEIDCQLLWLFADDAIARLRPQSQQWALARAIGKTA